MLSRDPFELTGSLDDKGKKMLLLHLMHNVIYDDSRRYLLNQVSALEEQRRQNLLESQGKRAARNVDNGSNCGGGDEPADEHAQQNDSSSNSGGGEAAAEQPTYGSTSGGEAEQSNGDHLEGNVEEIVPQQPSTKKGPKKNLALQAIQTNLRFGHLAEEQKCDGKRTSRPVVKLGSAQDGGSSEGAQLGRADSGGTQSKTTAGGNKLKKTEQKSKPIAGTPPRTSKAVRITKTTTKPATSTTGRRKRGQENTEQEEEEEMETQLKRPRGRPPIYNSIAAVPPEATSSSTATSSTHGNDLLAMQQRAFEKQLAELKAENAKVAKAQAAAVADALAKFSKDARARDRNEEQLGLSYLTKFYFVLIVYYLLNSRSGC